MPQNIEYGYSNFKQFIEKRNEIIKKELREALIF